MIRNSLVFGLIILLFACSKEPQSGPDNAFTPDHLRKQLKDSLAPHDYNNLRFEVASITKVGGADFSYYTVPLKTDHTSSEFILAKLNSNNTLFDGKIINLKRQKPIISEISYDGHLTEYTFKRNLVLEAEIQNGYIIRNGSNVSGQALKPTAVPVIYTTLPDVIVVASYSSDAGVYSYSSLAKLTSFYYNGNPGDATNTNSYTDVSQNGGGGYTSDPNKAAPILIDIEPVEDLSAIDITKYLKCFNSIPDAGAECIIRILTDIPVDTDPKSFFSWKTASPGHTFLQITKRNATQSVQQNIGFYPEQGWKTLINPVPVKAKFVDNFEHEFNASLSMSLSPEALRSTINYMLNVSRNIQYDIDDYNCTDFALNVFNHARPGRQILIPRYNIPRGEAQAGTNTPQGLYVKLAELKKQLGPESQNIIVPEKKSFVGKSSGPCN